MYNLNFSFEPQLDARCAPVIPMAGPSSSWHPCEENTSAATLGEGATPREDGTPREDTAHATPGETAMPASASTLGDNDGARPCAGDTEASVSMSQSVAELSSSIDHDFEFVKSAATRICWRPKRSSASSCTNPTPTPTRLLDPPEELPQGPATKQPQQQPSEHQATEQPQQQLPQQTPGQESTSSSAGASHVDPADNAPTSFSSQFSPGTQHFDVMLRQFIDLIRSAAPAAPGTASAISSPPLPTPATSLLCQSSLLRLAPPPGLHAPAVLPAAHTGGPGSCWTQGLAAARDAAAVPASDEAAASASTPGAAATALTVNDIPLFSGQCTGQKAHRWLKQLRRDCATAQQECVDLTDDPRWRVYVCSHPHARTIIGAGIIYFEGRFCNGREDNARTLNLPAPFGKYRFDFIAGRKDGTACRLHPSSGENSDTPVTGALDEWKIPQRTLWRRISYNRHGSDHRAWRQSRCSHAWASNHRNLHRPD